MVLVRYKKPKSDAGGSTRDVRPTVLYAARVIQWSSSFRGLIHLISLAPALEGAGKDCKRPVVMVSPHFGKSSPEVLHYP